MLHVWVYGTLRPRCGLDYMLGRYTDLGTVKLPGRLYYHRCGQYPVYVPHGRGTVVGNLLLVDEEHVARIITMEVLAGYSAEWRKVEVPTDDLDDWGDHVDALTFPWRGYIGDCTFIKSGDWMTTPGAVIVRRRHDNTT